MRSSLQHSIIYIYVLALLSSLTTCQKYSDEDYEGQWQLIEIAQSDGTSPKNVKADGVYWRMQLGILQVISTGLPESTNPGELIGNFNVSEGFLHLTAIYQSEREADILITTPETAAVYLPYGITAPTEDYRIDILTDDQLILTSSTLRLTFRKF